MELELELHQTWLDPFWLLAQQARVVQVLRRHFLTTACSPTTDNARRTWQPLAGREQVGAYFICAELSVPDSVVCIVYQTGPGKGKDKDVNKAQSLSALLGGRDGWRPAPRAQARAKADTSEIQGNGVSCLAQVGVCFGCVDSRLVTQSSQSVLDILVFWGAHVGHHQ